MLRKLNWGGVILATLLATSSCQDENLVDNPSPQSNQITLTASYAVSSRTIIGDANTDGSLPTLWSTDLDESGKSREKIFVSSYDGQVYGTLTLDPSSLTKGNTEGTFSGIVNGSPSRLEYSVYPVPDNGRPDGKIDLTVRDGQHVDAPMIGIIANNKNVTFRNTCAIRSFSKISNLGGNEVTITAKAGTEELQLGATAVVDFKTENGKTIPYLKYTSTSTGGIKITNTSDVVYVPFNISEANQKAEVEFFGKTPKMTTAIALTDKIDLTSAEPGNIVASEEKELHVVDGQIVEPTDDEANDFTNKTPATTSGEQQNVPTYTMQNSNSVNLTTIPASSNVALEVAPSTTDSSTNPTEKVLSIKEVNTTVETLILTESSTDDNTGGEGGEGDDEEEGTNEAVQKVVIALPATADGKELDVNMPNTTVTLEPNNGASLNIKKVVALTADNTFIIKENVTIKELFAVRGSIEVSGIVESLVRDAAHLYGDSKVSVLIKKGGQVKNTLDSSIFNVEYEGDAPIVDEPEETPIEMVTIENVGFSAALQTLLGTDSISLNDDGYAVMTKTYAESLKKLSFINSSSEKKYTITSLEGIENFPNLTYVAFRNTGLTSCDLSKNTALTGVDVQQNELTELDLSKNTKLRDIYCASNLNLSSLNISGCTNLSTLRLTETALKSIYIPNPENIGSLEYGYTSLSFDWNKFTSLYQLECSGQDANELNDIPATVKEQLINLTCSACGLSTLNLNEYPNLKALHCYENNLTSLDLSSCPNLEFFNCSDNQLTSLDLSVCPKLTGVLCINNGLTNINLTGLVGLTQLNLEENALTSLKMPNCTELRYFSCYKNQLTSLDLSACTPLNTVYCGQQTNANGKTITMKLKLSDAIKEKWSGWSGIPMNSGVELVDELEEDTPSSEASGNTSGNGFNIETIY